MVHCVYTQRNVRNAAPESQFKKHDEEYTGLGKNFHQNCQRYF